LEKLIKIHPSQVEPAMVYLISRLDEQVQLSVFGESDPQAFRMQIHERLNKGKGPKHTSATIQAYITPTDLSGTPVPGQNGHDNGNKMHQPSDVPGHGDEGNGKGQSTPGNGNRKPHLTRTPTP
jgi:hypothetical protein